MINGKFQPSTQWSRFTEKLKSRVKELATTFYYQKYFEWGLPMRCFAQVNIETTNTCTRSCHFCLFGTTEKMPSMRMPANLCLKIIDELAAINFSGRFSLFNINEPLTDNRIFSFVNYASLMLPGSYHALVTNGDILDREKLKKLLDAGLDQLFINSYDELALRRNLSLYNYAYEYYPGKVTHINRTQYNDWVSRAGNIKAYAQDPVAGYCDWPNYALYVKPDGRVLACCHDFSGINVVGNLVEQSVLEVWYGKAFSRLRRSLNKGQRSISSLCNQCDHKPDLNYFKTNHLMPYVHKKKSLLASPIPTRDDKMRAQSIREDLLMHESRSVGSSSTLSK
jgi:radical SAM protein with 4Fe4S-binding SPASM domain